MTFPFKSKLQAIRDVSEEEWIEQVGYGVYEKMLKVWRDQQEVTVHSCSVDSGEADSSYYNISFDDGTLVDDLHGLHLKTLPGEQYTLGVDYTIQLFFSNYTDGSVIDHDAIAVMINNAVAKELKTMGINCNPLVMNVAVGSVAYETDYRIEDDGSEDVGDESGNHHTRGGDIG